MKKYICNNCKEEVKESQVPHMLFHGMCLDCSIKESEVSKTDDFIIER